MTVLIWSSHLSGGYFALPGQTLLELAAGSRYPPVHTGRVAIGGFPNESTVILRSAADNPAFLNCTYQILTIGHVSTAVLDHGQTALDRTTMSHHQALHYF